VHELLERHGRESVRMLTALKVSVAPAHHCASLTSRTGEVALLAQSGEGAEFRYRQSSCAMDYWCRRLQADCG
jgi:hypothetical protein